MTYLLTTIVMLVVQNRRTWSWNAAGAMFALGFGTLAHYDYLAVGQDQLIGGTWPDNEPAVSCLDWQTGEPNAKYWVTNLLATTVGRAVTKSIVACNVTGGAPGPPPSKISCLSGEQWAGGDVGVANLTVAAAVGHCRMLPKCGGFTTATAGDTCSAGGAEVFEMHFKDSWGVKNGHHVKGSTSWPLPQPPLPPSSATPVYVMPYLLDGKRGALLINKKAVRTTLRLQGISGGVATIVEVEESAAEPGFAPPLSRTIGVDGELSLGPFAVAVLSDLQIAASNTVQG